MSTTMQAAAAALTSWVVGLLAMAGAYQDQITFWLGFILVAARLAQEVPKAYKTVKGWFYGKDDRL